MDFLKKMFEKKECSICGKESGLLGNRKLEDGNLCKECTSKLSPWFEERRHATVQSIQAHLWYREQNQISLQKMKPIKSFGEYYKIYIGYEGVYPVYFIISKEKDYVAENADIILISNLRNCRLDINEYCTELTKLDENKRRISYNPPRFEYRFEFYVVLEVDLNYCNEIKFKLNKHSVKVEVERRRNIEEDPTRDVNYQYFKNMYLDIERDLVEGMKYAPKMMDKLYEMNEESRKKMQEIHDKQKDLEQASEMMKQNIANKPKFCPACGAAAGAGKFCRECGYQLIK